MRTLPKHHVNKIINMLSAQFDGTFEGDLQDAILKAHTQIEADQKEFINISFDDIDYIKAKVSQ